MKAKRSVALVALLATSVLALSACGGDTSEKSAKGSGESAGAVLPNTAWSAANYDDVRDGGTLVQAIGQLPLNYNFHQVDGSLAATLTVENPLLLSGLTFKPDGTWQVDPNVIESAKMVSQDPQKIEVKLNPKAVWSDGQPITYLDFVNTWKALQGKDPEFRTVADDGYRDIENVEKGKTQFEYTITWAKKNADWPIYMYPVAPSLVTSTPSAFNAGFSKKMFPGNGPFVVSDIDANAGVITETPNPRWWGRKPKLDKLIFRVVTPDVVGEAFANKEIDVLDTAANADSLAQGAKRPDSEIQRAGGREWTHLTLNGLRAPLDNVHVRRAIGLAIDRRTLISVVQKRLGVEPAVQGSVIYVPGQAGYQDVASKEIPFDLKKSAAELKKAGYTKGDDGMYEKDGKPLSITITVPAQVPNSAQRAQLIQGFLKKAGIELTLETVPPSKYFDDYVSTEKMNFETTSFSWSGGPFPVSGTQALFNPAKAGANYSGITDDRLGGLFDKANAESDASKQQVIAHEIDKTIFEYVPIIPLGTTPTIWAVKKGVVNIGASQFQNPDYTEVGFRN